MRNAESGNYLNNFVFLRVFVTPWQKLWAIQITNT